MADRQPLVGGGKPFPIVAVWWVGFLAILIAGERLELSRLLGHTAVSRSLFAGSTAIFLTGLVITSAASGEKVGVMGVGLTAIALWLLRYDVARRTSRQTAVVRYAACCLLAGYLWLAIAGIVAILTGTLSAGVAYDAILHAVFSVWCFPWFSRTRQLSCRSCLEYPFRIGRYSMPICSCFMHRWRSGLSPTRQDGCMFADGPAFQPSGDPCVPVPYGFAIWHGRRNARSP